MASPRLSIVIPTYNRRDLLPAAVDSARAWLDAIGEGEIVIVDDGSSDGTGAMLADLYRGELASGRIAFHERACNGGAAAAKNSGAAIAKGDWIVWLDSDDLLVAEALPAVLDALDLAGPAPVVFFRCVDLATGALVGEPLAETRTLPLDRYVAGWKWGECLPIVRPDAARRFPYVEELPGYEAVSYYRMTRAIADPIVTPIVARRYRTEGADRVSAAGRRARGIRNRKFALIMMREFRHDLPRRIRARYLLTYVRSRMDAWIAGTSRLLTPAR